MKKVVCCSKCEKMAYKFGIGFNSNTEWFCTERGGQVDEDDGCTFGREGEPRVATDVNYTIDISQDAAVNGWYDGLDW